MASGKTDSYSKEGIIMTTLTVVRVGLFALAIVALGFVPGVSMANPPSATGNGDFMLGGELRTFSFSAIQQPNGNVAGQAEVHNRAMGTVVHMDINCIVFLPNNTVVVSGTITKNSPNPPNLVGLSGVFQAQDNGEGTNSSPDRLSLVVPGDCTTTPPALMDILHGNIQVRP
jgi:hypothetical protein